MSRETGLIILGVLSAVLPFSGFPRGWLEIFFLAIGAAVVWIGFAVRADAYPRHGRRAPTFVENGERRLSDLRPPELQDSSPHTPLS